MARGKGRGGGRGRGRGGRRQASRRSSPSDQVTIPGNQLLGSVPAGTGGFTYSTLVAYPSEATIAPIAACYSEYRYSYYRICLVPAGSSSTVGNGFVAFQLSPPVSLADYAQASALSGFRAGPGFGRNTSSVLDTRGRARRWFELVPGTPTSAQLVDPDIVQAWPTVGSQGVQSGLVAWDVYVYYSIQLRGRRPNTVSLPPAVVSLTLPTTGTASQHLHDVEEDTESDDTAVQEG